MRPQGSAAELESRRRLAVRLLEGGLDPPEVADVVEATLRSVQRWRSAKNLEAIAPCGRPPKLTSRQTTRVLSWVDGHATNFGFTTDRWTAPRIAQLVRQRLGVAMNPRYLNRWLALHGGITPQVPARRAAERDEALIARWQRVAWPRIKRRAADTGAALGFTDEAGFLPLPLIRTTLAPRGQTPTIAHRAHHRDKLSVAAALPCLRRGGVGMSACTAWPSPTRSSTPAPMPSSCDAVCCARCVGRS